MGLLSKGHTGLDIQWHSCNSFGRAPFPQRFLVLGIALPTHSPVLSLTYCPSPTHSLLPGFKTQRLDPEGLLHAPTQPLESIFSHCFSEENQPSPQESVNTSLHLCTPGYQVRLFIEEYQLVNVDRTRELASSSPLSLGVVIESNKVI